MSETVHTLVTGGTGTLGQALLPRLQDAGHDVVATSRSPPGDENAVDWRQLDLADGTGIEAAVEEIDVLVHTASAPLGDTAAVDVEGTKRLLEAAADASVDNFVYISIVGIDEIPYSYYEAKLDAERAVEASDVPSTILRTTQFHPFVREMLELVTKLPVWFLPTKMRTQPIDVGEVADRLVELATPDASGRVDPMGGPEIHTVRELAEAYRVARGSWRPIVHVPIPTAVFKRFREGAATCPEYAEGTATWGEWLADAYGDAG